MSKRLSETLFGQISTRVFLAFSLIFVALILMFAFVSLKQNRKYVYENAANELRVHSVIITRQAQKVIDRLQATVSDAEFHSRLIQAWRQEQVAGDGGLMRLLQERKASNPLFEELYFLDRTGQVAGASGYPWLGAAVPRDTPFFVRGLREVSFSHFVTEGKVREQIIAAPVQSGGKVAGVIAGQIDLSRVYDLIDQSFEAENYDMDAFLLDGSLRFITTGKTGEERLLESHLVSTELSSNLDQPFWVEEYNNYFGTKVLGTMMKVPGSPWWVVVERDYDNILEPVSAAVWMIAGTTSALILVLLSLSLLLARSITRPLSRLVKGARQIAAGDFEAAIGTTGGPVEVKALAREFEKMRDQVDKYRKRLLAQLETSETKRRDSERLAAVGTLASTLAHEIRNPLNAMALLLTRLESRRADADFQSRIVDSIRDEIERLNRLVTSILDHARPLQIRPERFSLADLVASVFSVNRELASQRGILLTLHQGSGPLEMTGDEDGIRQCLVNVLNNAFDASEHGSEVRVTLDSTPDSVVMEVRDFGHGFGAVSPSRLFDLFYTTKDSGTGLGLSTVKKIVDAHHGLVMIRSETDDEGTPAGTLVRIELPRNSRIREPIGGEIPRTGNAPSLSLN